MLFKIEIENNDERLLPTKANKTDAGFDLKANKVFKVIDNKLSSIAEELPFILSSGERVLVQSGIKIELCPGWEAQVRPRSGLALKNGITVTNSPGTIDPEYRGTVGVILQNTGDNTFTIKKYDRIAQLVITQIPEVELLQVDNLDTPTNRGEEGFGSTGVN